MATPKPLKQQLLIPDPPPAFVPTDEHRKLVLIWTGGRKVSQRSMAIHLGCTVKELQQHFRRELEEGAARFECWLAVQWHKLIKDGDWRAMEAALREVGFLPGRDAGGGAAPNSLPEGVFNPRDVTLYSDAQLARIIAESEPKPAPPMALPAPEAVQ